jgi:hypothetical protein
LRKIKPQASAAIWKGCFREDQPQRLDFRDWQCQPTVSIVALQFTAPRLFTLTQSRVAFESQAGIVAMQTLSE